MWQAGLIVEREPVVITVIAHGELRLAAHAAIVTQAPPAEAHLRHILLVHRPGELSLHLRLQALVHLPAKTMLNPLVGQKALVRLDEGEAVELVEAADEAEEPIHKLLLHLHLHLRPRHQQVKGPAHRTPQHQEHPLLDRIGHRPLLLLPLDHQHLLHPEDHPLLLRIKSGLLLSLLIAELDQIRDKLPTIRNDCVTYRLTMSLTSSRRS